MSELGGYRRNWELGIQPSFVNGIAAMFNFFTVGELSGIFVKSIAEGSAAAVDGRLRVNDQIIEV